MEEGGKIVPEKRWEYFCIFCNVSIALNSVTTVILTFIFRTVTYIPSQSKHVFLY